MFYKHHSSYGLTNPKDIFKLLICTLIYYRQVLLFGVPNSNKLFICTLELSNFYLRSLFDLQIYTNFM